MDDIRAFRRKIGVTQVELATLLGLHQSTISRLESGALPIDERTKLALEALSSRKPPAPRAVDAHA
jgi:predicted transcriptional regulator